VSARDLPLLTDGGRGGQGISGAAPARSQLCEFNYEPPVLRPLPPAIRWLSDRSFLLFLILVFVGTPIAMFIAYFRYDDHDAHLWFLPCQKEWRDLVKYLSIPLVSIVFTWWHVWLGIQMCFYPVNFVGCCRPYIGWQGIVPRRAAIMANRACDIMLGRLITVEEIIARIEPEAFFCELQPVLDQTCAAVLKKLAQARFPTIWETLPDQVRDEIQRKVLEESREMFDPVIQDLKARVHEIVDFKEMAVEILCEDKRLLVEMFLRIGRCEFVFIQHVAAVMGCALGIVQMLLWLALNSGSDVECTGAAKSSFRCWGGYVILPVSGLIIGYFTNWLGITMIFRPVEPRIICNGYINIQGVFLARQQEVSKELAETVCKNLVHAKRMVEYIAKRGHVIDRVIQIYQRHTDAAIDSVVSSLPLRMDKVLPMVVGPEAIQDIKKSVMQLTMDEIREHETEVEAFMDRHFALPETMAYRLARLQPRVFEDMLHPVFQEDEWMVLLLGGVLGVVVGGCQAAALGS